MRGNSPQKNHRGVEFNQLTGKMTYRGIPVDQMASYPLWLAALVMGISYTKLWRLVSLGDLKMSPGKLISRAEVDRFLECAVPAANAA